MDLAGFDAVFDTKQDVFKKGVHSLLDRWFSGASRSARWMDLLGDYAGSEPFVIDGEALFQIVLDDPLLSIGRDACSFQILHAYHSLEHILEEYRRRRANFEVVFWDDTKHLSIQTEGNDFAVSSRALARSMLFNHLIKLPFGVHVFESLNDPLWIRYAFEKKPMFVMSNDGSVEGSTTHSPITFYQRAFLLNILSCGISVTLLKGTEYRDSKILSFVYEPLVGTENVLAALQPHIDSTRASLQAKFASKFNGADYSLKLERVPVSNSNEVEMARFLQELNILSPMVPPAVVYLFIAHLFLLPSLTIHQRAQTRRALPLGLEAIIQSEFLTPVFLEMARLLASQNQVVDLDGTIYTTLIALVLSRPEDIGVIIGNALEQKALAIWKSLEGPTLSFDIFRSQYSLAKEHGALSSCPDLKEPRPLLPFSNPIFDGEFSIFSSSSDGNAETNFDSLSSSAKVEWSDNQHWHNQKSILPRHLGGLQTEPNNSDPKALRRKLRSDQRFMANLQDQAATLTGAAGAILQQMVIPPVPTSKPSKVERKSTNAYLVSKQTKKEPKLNSAEKLKRKLKEEKMATSKASSENKWTEHLLAMSKQSLSSKLESITTLFRNMSLISEPHILVEMQLYRIQLELEMWIMDDNRASPTMRDKYTVSLMRIIQDICRKKVITLPVKKALTAVLVILGFGGFAESLLSKLETIDHPPGFPFIKLISSKTKTVLPDYDFMAIVEHPVIWQLRLFGDYMDRSMDSAPDGRVSFDPDAWQRRVLDGIDQEKSLLVVAPTSAGKTFISYYAMEKVLRGSNDGILVYVAPTKALVTQIAAEVYARFKKDLNGKSCWAIHTRDFRIHNPQGCQILVTVPEMLSIMLLSPPLAKTWTPRIKRIVLDEIHCIGQQEGGAVWEQILLFAPCPIIGLSATIGLPELFSDWLASVQKAHGFEYEFIEHHHRYSHLRKFYYLIDGEGTFESLNTHRSTTRMQFMHPITMLLFGATQIPSDLSLEAADTLSLYYALSSVQNDISRNFQVLEPSIFFSSSSGLLRQKDVLAYETKLKEVIADLLPSFDARDLGSPLGRVITSLQGQSSSLSDENIITRTTLSPSAIKDDLLVLLADLHVRNDLPAILFSFDRSNCEILARHITKTLKTAEQKWRSESPAWARKIDEWNAWKLASLARARAFEKARKQKKKGEDIRDTPEMSWHSSFDPNKPSPEFTFTGQCTTYSTAQLEDDIKSLAWTAIPEWAFAALRRGIAVHHSGMNKHYRSLVESLLRKGFIRVMIATGTLALGINAPAKTSIFLGDSPFLTALMYRQCAGRAGRRGFDLRGNVIFYGLPLDRVRRLVLSKLPTLGGNFPLTSTTTLRLFNLLNGSDNADVAVRAVKSILSLPQITMNTDFGQDQLLHHLRFSIEYLRRSSLLDDLGTPVDFAAIAAHLYYTEPSNLALVALLRSKVLRDICNQDDEESAKRTFMLVMCNLFGRRYLSKGFTGESNIRALVKKYPSMVILPPLPKKTQEVLIAHDEDILKTFQGYALAFSKRMDTIDNTLTLSGLHIGGHADDAEFALIHQHLQETAIPIVVRSPFIANSGHGDSFTSVLDLTRTSRAGLSLNYHAIPTMSSFTNVVENSEGHEHRLNAYILDFYIHGQVRALIDANCIRRGDMWYLLQDFTMTLMTVRAALLQLFSKTPEGEDAVTLSENLESEDEHVSDDAKGEDEEASDAAFRRPPGVSTEDWKFLTIVHQVCEEFEAKFRAMWA